MSAAAWGFLALVGLWLSSALVLWSFNPSVLVKGEDGRPSSSKLQLVLWTATVVFSYASVFAAAFRRSGWQTTVTIPDEILAVMGLSVVTMVSSKAITVAQLANGRVAKPFQRSAPLSSLLTDDAGNPELAKVQMLAWTLIAIVTYLARTHALLSALPAGDVRLPGLDQGMVILCGVGQAAYLGKKLVSPSTPRLTGISPATGRAPLPVTISGISMGQKDGASLVVDGTPVAAFVSSWADDRIELTLPPTRPDGTPWPRDRSVSLGVLTGGRPSSNTLLFTFTP